MSKTCFVKNDGLSAFMAFLSRQGRVLAPREKPAAHKTGVVFAPWQQGDPVLLAKGSVSPKEAVLPECETLLRFALKRDPFSGEVSFSLTDRGEAVQTVIFACRPCDANGIWALDKPFLQGLYADPYYRARREALTVMTLTCNSGCETCFCHWVGGSPSSPRGSDVLMTQLEDGLLLQAVTARGEALLGESGLPDGAERFPEAQAVRQKAWQGLVPAPDIRSAPQKLAAVFSDSGFWERQTDKCLSCGACTYFCPSCYCFSITDEGEAQFHDGGRRLRSWDNCMSSLYTREASGHNPRPRKSERMRNRVAHKFWTYAENWGSNLCTGCGRCIANCPVHLDIRSIVLAAINHEPAGQNGAK